MAVALVVAAGRGERLGSGGPKAFVMLGGRPMVQWSIDALRAVDALAAHDCDAAIAATPVTDTIKESDGEEVVRTLERANLWAVQTPQVFDRTALERALSRDDAELAAATDDAALVERDGGTVRVVPAPRENLKVTTPLDLRLAELLLAAR